MIRHFIASRLNTLRSHSERGITMIELLVYMVLAPLVLVMVGGLLINSITTQQTVRTAAEANTTGQLVMRSVDSGVRNASAVQVSENGRLLVARTSIGADAWICRAWYVDPADQGTVYMTESTTAAGIDTSTAASGWTQLAVGATVGITEPFTPVTMPIPGNTSVTLTLKLDAGNSSDVALTRTIAPRLPSVTPGDCFS